MRRDVENGVRKLRSVGEVVFVEGVGGGEEQGEGG